MSVRSSAPVGISSSRWGSREDAVSKLAGKDFLSAAHGDIPVIDYLRTLNPKLRAKAFSEIELIKKHGSALREPYVKPVTGQKCKGIYELRVISAGFFILHSKGAFRFVAWLQ